jgi:hypothetical protein
MELMSRSNQKQLDKEDREHLLRDEGGIIIPEKQPDPNDQPNKYRRFEEHYNISRCEKNFRKASKIKEMAENIESKDETRWSELIIGKVFDKLIGKARAAEGTWRKPTASEVLGRFRA